MKKKYRKQIKTMQQEKPPDHKDKSTQSNERHISGDVHVRGNVEVGFPESLVERYEAAKNASSPRENKEFWMSFGTLVFVAVTAIAALWQGCLTRQAVNESVTQFEATQRAWVGIRGPKALSLDVRPSTGGTANSVLTLNLLFALENFGNSPASDIAIYGSFVPAATSEDKPPEDWQRKGCDHTEKMSKDAYFTNFLMPKTYTADIPRIVIGSSVTKVEDIKHLWVIGCVGYRTANSGSFRHTRIILSADYSGGKVGSFGIYHSDAD